MIDFFNSVLSFFDKLWTFLGLLIQIIFEMFTAIIDIVSFPIQLVVFLPPIVTVGVTIGVAIMVIKFIGGR